MHSLQTKILTWLDIEADELKPVGLSFAISFTWGFSQMLSWTASSTLFLKYYSAADLPYVSIASAVLIPMSGLLFLQLNRRLRYSTQFLIFAALFVLAPVTFRVLMLHGGWHWPSMGYAIWYYLEVAFSALLMSSLVTRLFNLRQVKRVYGPIQTGSDLAGVPAGFLVALIVAEFGVENLLLFSAVINAIVLGLFAWMERSYRTKMQIATETEDGEDEDGGAPEMPVMALFRMPLVLCILGIVALAEFNLQFINIAFYARTQIFLPKAAEMATFLGNFFAVASIISSIVQMLASSRLMKWLGIGGSLVLGPAVVGAALIMFLASNHLAMAAVIVFGCMAGAKFMQYAVWANVNDVSQFTLTRSLAPAIQDRVLTLSGTVLGPVFGGLSGIILLVMTHVFGATAVAISMVVIVILALTIVIGLRGAREYRHNLNKLLASRAITGIELPLHDADTAKRLLTLAADPDPKTALCSLELLSRHMHAALKPALRQALQHPDPQVRREATLVYLRLGSAEDLPVVMEQLRTETDPAVIGELLPVAARLSGGECRQVLINELRSNEPLVVRGACVGLVRYCPGPGAAAAHDLLLEMCRSEDAGRRTFVAEILEEIRSSELDELIIPLLRDPDRHVRAAAIVASGRLNHPDLGIALLENVNDPQLRPLVVNALTYSSESILPSIDALLDKPGSERAVKQTILAIFGRIKSPICIQLLRHRLNASDTWMRGEVIKALAQCRYRSLDDDQATIQARIHEYCVCATWLLACIVEIDKQRDKEMLVRALEYELRRIKETLLMLLGFIYPQETIDHVRVGYFNSRSEDKVAAALELLDNTLRGKHRDHILAIFETGSLERRVAALEKFFPLEAGGLVKRLVEIIVSQYKITSSWLQAVTLDFAHRTGAEDAIADFYNEDTVQDTTRRWLKRPGRLSGASASSLSVVEKVAALNQATIFAEVPDEILAEYAPAAIERFIPAGERIIRQGETGTTMSVIVAGRVRISRGGKSIAEMADGEIFGELSALSPEPRSADVDAVSDTRLLEMNGEIIEKMISEQLEAARGILRILSIRIQSTIRKQSYEDTGSFSIVRTERMKEPEAPIPETMLSVAEKAVLLKTVDIFGSLPHPVLTHLASLSREQWVERGAVLFNQGDLGTSMYVIVDGEIAVHDDDRLIAVLRRGKIIGELALLTSEVRSTSISALEPSRLLKITQRAMEELLWDHERMRRSLVQVLATRLRNMASGQQPTPG